MNSSKNIILSVGDYTGKGGIERAFNLLANALSDINYEVTITNWNRPISKPTFPVSGKVSVESLNAKGFWLQRIKNPLIRKVLNIFSLPYFVFTNNARAKKYIHAKKPDYIITTDVKTALFWYFNSPKAIKIITTEQFNYNESGWLFCKIKKWLFSKLHTIVLLNKEELNIYQRFSKKIEIIPNLSNINPKAIPSQHSYTNKIVSAGRLMPQKGYDLLIESWIKLGDKTNGWTLDIYGEGKEQESLTDLSKHIENISFHGFTSELDQKFKDAAFYVMSSRYEGLGMVLIEALDNGLPCVSFACPTGPKSIIQPGVNGLLALPGNTDDLANKIIELIEDPDLLKRLRQNAPNSISDYRADKIIGKWQRLLI